MFLLIFRQRKGQGQGGERENHPCEKQGSVASRRCPDPGWNQHHFRVWDAAPASWAPGPGPALLVFSWNSDIYVNFPEF